MPPEAQPYEILIVEDNREHQRLTEYILRRQNVNVRFTVVRDGQEALDFLYRNGQYSGALEAPLPHLILLDLNLPKRDGREVLRLIKEDPVLQNIPIVIVSTSDREEDVAYAMRTGAIAYISKSSGFDALNQQLADIMKYAKIVG